MESRWIYEFGGEVATLCLAGWYLARALVPNWMPMTKRSRKAVALEGMLWFVCAVGLYEDSPWATSAVAVLVTATSGSAFIDRRKKR